MIKRFFLIATLLLNFSALYADPVNDLNQKLQNFKTLTADFTQQVENENGEVLQTSQGKIAIKRPGLFRWQVTKPLQQLIVTDGKTVWVSEPDLQQVTKQTLSDNISQTPLLLLSGEDYVLQHGYDIQQNIHTANRQGYKLLSKHTDDNFQRVDIIFKKDTPYELKLYSAMGQLTVIKFQNVQLNPSLSNSLFSFQIPRGVDVIDMTHQGQ